MPSFSSLLVTASSDQLDLDDYNLVVDATATAAFSVDTTAETITVKSSTMDVGDKFTSITTTEIRLIKPKFNKDYFMGMIKCIKCS